MHISTKILRALKSQLGFDHDPPEDVSVVYKGLAPQISLYFEKENDNGGPYIGFWMSTGVNSNLRNNLKVEFHNVILGNRCGGIDESIDSGNVWIYCPIIASDDSIIDWVVAVMEEAERRSLFLINK